jgi:hypothetical protein
MRQFGEMTGCLFLLLQDGVLLLSHEEKRFNARGKPDNGGSVF